jgi:transmembrane sensor
MGETREGAGRSNFFAAAADWHTRLDDDDVPLAVRAEFDAWLAADARHRETYRSVDRMWTRMGESPADPRALNLRRDALNATRGRRRWPNVFAFRSLGNGTVREVDFAQRRPLRFLIAAAVGMVACSAMWVGIVKIQDRAFEGSAFLAGNNRVEGGAFRTAIGERSTVTMSDGSVIVLNTNTRVDIRFSPKERHIRLAGGQAWFQVAKNPNRPFVVEAGEQRVLALGTAFDVRLADKDAVQVTLLEGRVIVEPIQSRLAALLGPPPRISELTPGESLLASGSERVTKRKADVSKIAGWRLGQVVFDNDTLASAVAEVNRYSSTQIVLADPALATLPVSGVFAVGHIESFIETVTSHYPIRITERTGERVVLATTSP